MARRIGIDTGGTFTDVVAKTGQGIQVHKLPSTPDDPARAVLAGLAAVRRHPDEAVDVVHGTTVGLNAVLTGKLARTLFVTNRGCEDLIEIGRQERTELYALDPDRTAPPVPRELRLGVDCRRGPGGVVERALTEAAVQRIVAAARRRRPAAIAIGLLHSPADDRDERRLAAALQRALPDVPITTSAELLPAYGEYERFCATILNAATAPVVGGYTQRLQQALGRGQLRLMRSSLGILPPDEAARFPARAMFSGPAGGVQATAQLLAAMRLGHGAAFDMGGTSADLCLVGDEALVHEEGTIGGLPLCLPTVPVHTVGCGGGSIAYRDRGGALRVGPESAGADPGPACFGKGELATVTDAHVALGHLGEKTLLGGEFPIDVDAAVRAIERLGRRLGLGAAATARGILTVADATMARAILRITAERAVDPAHVTLVAYGGSGGLHAASLTMAMGMPRAVIPPWPGAFSALGLALAGESLEQSVACRVELTSASLRQLHTTGARLVRDVAEQGGHRRGTTCLEAHVRYRGQGAALRLPWSTNLGKRFTDEHQRRFGFVTTGAIEVVRLTATWRTNAASLPKVSVATRRSKPKAQRLAPLGNQRWSIHDRADVTTIQGPAIVEETTATTLVPAGFQLHATPNGLRLERHAAKRSTTRV
ncbi:MAG: hydantoinase/oxoprolinase family protein [Planctomycetota bacterium]